MSTKQTEVKTDTSVKVDRNQDVDAELRERAEDTTRNVPTGNKPSQTSTTSGESSNK